MGDCSLTLWEKQLIRIFGTDSEEVKGGLRELHNNSHNFSLLNIVVGIKSRRISFAL
jgi:hypothetical protein